MKSITIHGLDDALERFIRERAITSGKSLNKTIKELLRESLGMKSSLIEVRRKRFSRFLGVWTEEEGREFNKRIKCFEKIDKKDWQ